MIVNSKQSLSNCIIELKSKFEKYHFLKVVIKKETRTNKQNNWIYEAYNMISKQSDLTPIEVRRYCKLNLGLVILFENDEDSASRWRLMMKSLGYEERLKAMDLISVTSLFDTEQGAKYINSIIIEYQTFELPEKQT